ncbi:hypothetical protein BRD18_04205 [Halobacteriales archaeon SW_7_71_33]|nr:MAG: hypothetical protein BRD18_04205 [Halobacteriales archaeon SW_7_71_33]
MSTRRSVPTGVQFITAVGGFAAGLVTLTGLLGLYVAVQDGNLGLAVRFLPMLGLGVGHLAGLYGLVRLRRWGYRWTRRLFAATLLVNLPGARTGDPLTVGTVGFSVFVLGYLWLADTKTFRPRPDGSAPTPGEGPDGAVDGREHGRSEEPIRIEDVHADDEDGDGSDEPADPLASGGPTGAGDEEGDGDAETDDDGTGVDVDVDDEDHDAGDTDDA